ncbi:MAG: AAA family ATPase [Leptotrichia hongkongensis]|nr:AAA family ATPase [Leptotrichia hongkongensis]
MDNTNNKFKIDELAKEYGLTNEQMTEFLISNNIEIGNNDIEAIINVEDRKKLEKLNLTESKFHKNQTSLKSIQIKKLFGKYDYKIDFEKDISIWISENGIGKTTILNIIYAILNNNEELLFEINFSEIIVKIGKKEFKIEKNIKKINSPTDLKARRDKKRVLMTLDELYHYSPLLSIKKLRNDFLHTNNLNFNLVNNVIREIAETSFYSERHYRMRMQLLDYLNEYSYGDFSETLYKIKEELSEDLLFYPTYRRIEIGFEKIFSEENRRDRFLDTSKKNIEFGMRDVKKRIDSLLKKMEQDANISYVNMNANIISELLTGNSISSYIERFDGVIDTHKVDVIIKRIGEGRIQNIDKLKEIAKNYEEKNSNTTETNTEFLIYYLQKLVNIYDSQRLIDDKLKKFATICSKYLVNKKIIYDETTLSMDIFDEENNKIDFEALSSGEKQIVSIFSKVYLDLTTNCIFIIDEPEISLSIEWQKEFLKDIYNSEKIGLLIATTHSPFIFKNEYIDYVIELDKYLEGSYNE